MISAPFGFLSIAAEEADQWLSATRQRLGWSSERAAILALKSTLHALRDELGTDQSARLATELPVLIRGLYYEGWQPADCPRETHDQNEFLCRVGRGCRAEPALSNEETAAAVLRVLAQKLSSESIEALKHDLPPELRKLWPGD